MWHSCKIWAVTGGVALLKTFSFFMYAATLFMYVAGCCSSKLYIATPCIFFIRGQYYNCRLLRIKADFWVALQDGTLTFLSKIYLRADLQIRAFLYSLASYIHSPFNFCCIKVCRTCPQNFLTIRRTYRQNFLRVLQCTWLHLNLFDYQPLTSCHLSELIQELQATRDINLVTIVLLPPGRLVEFGAFHPHLSRWNNSCQWSVIQRKHNLLWEPGT